MVPEKSYENMTAWVGGQYGLVARDQSKRQNSGNSSFHSLQTIQQDRGNKA